MGQSMSYPELEGFLSDTVARVAELHETQEEHGKMLSKIPDMKSLLESLAISQTSLISSQSSMAESAKRMADVFEKSEKRQENLETEVRRGYETAAGKDQLPLKTHYITVAMVALPAFAICFSVIVYVLYMTKTDLNATLTTIQLNQQKTQEIVRETKDQVLNQASEIDTQNDKAATEKNTLVNE
jgi:hypothetical protein